MPERLKSLAEKIFQSIAVPVRFQLEPSKVDGVTGGPSHMEITKNNALNLAEIVVGQYGNKALNEIRRHLTTLCTERTDIIHVVLNLEDPGTINMAEELERFGLMFGGILPYGLAGSHALILQYLNNIKIDFHRINLITSEASMILNMIKRYAGDAVGRRPTLERPGPNAERGKLKKR